MKKTIIFVLLMCFSAYADYSTDNISPMLTEEAFEGQDESTHSPEPILGEYSQPSYMNSDNKRDHPKMGIIRGIRLGENSNTWGPAVDGPMVGADPNTWGPAVDEPMVGADPNTWGPAVDGMPLFLPMPS